MSHVISILLIEDDRGHAELVRRSIAEHARAHRLDHVRDGQEALDYLLPDALHSGSKPPPDLILLDLRLPKVDGQQVLQRLRNEPTLCRIPTVVLTTSEAEEDVRAAYANGACSYLVKSVDFTRFTEIMKAFCDYWLSCNRFAPNSDP